MGDVGGEQAGGAVHIQIGLPRVGAVESGKIHSAEQPGEKHFLRLPVRPGQKGELPGKAVVNLGAAGENILPGHSENAVFVPGHLPRRFLQLFGEVQGHPLQLLRRHRLGIDAALLLEAVGVVVHPPGHTIETVSGQKQARQPQYPAIGRVPAPSLPGPQAIEQHCQPGHHPQDEGCIEPLHHGEGKQVPQPRIPVLHPLSEGGDGVGGLWTAGAVPVYAEQRQNPQQPNMYSPVPFQKLFHVCLPLALQWMFRFCRKLLSENTPPSSAPAGGSSMSPPASPADVLSRCP